MSPVAIFVPFPPKRGQMCYIPSPPHSLNLSHTEASCERPAPEVAALTSQGVTAPGKHGVPFQKAPPRTPIIGTTPSTTTRGPARLALTTEPHPQQVDTPIKTAGTNERPTGHIRPPGVTAPRTEIVNYLRKTNICFRFAFGSPCPCYLAGSCPFVHDTSFRKGLSQRPTPSAEATVPPTPAHPVG